MASIAAINEPFLLSNYSITQRSSKSSPKSKYPCRRASVYASYQKPNPASDGFVTVAAQSDGVHVVDVATLHPVISHTLGPSTSFACAPLTQHQPSKNTHTTFAVVSSSPDLDPEHRGKTIWKWSENLSSALADRPSSSSKSQQALVVPHLVAGLHDCESLSDRIIAISPAGDISLLSTDLELKTTRPTSGEESIVHYVCVFSRMACSFLGSRSEGAVIALLIERGASVQFEVYCVDIDDSIESAFVHEVPLDDDQEIATASCSPSGILNIIAFTGSWYTFSLTPSAITPVASPLQLNGLSFVPPPPLSTKRTQSQRKAATAPSLLALTSSHVLLASQTLQNEIALLLWDTQYSILLTSHHFPLPTTFATQTPLTISLLSSNATGVHAGNQQVVLVMSQSTSEADGKTPVKSSIYVVPYSAPVRSTLANAVGRANAGARWLVESGSSEKDREVTLEGAPRPKVVINMRNAVEQNRPQAANALFMEWEKKEQEKLGDESAVTFGYSFVKDLLDAVIQPEKPPSPLYSSEVVRHLIDKGVVRSAMIGGGLLASLRLRNDWPSIDLALKHVPDLSENELIETLKLVVNRNQSEATTADPSAMQVDTTSSTLDQTPTLSDFLTTMLKYRQFTAPQLVIAFRHHMQSAEAVTSIVQLLDVWLKKVQSQDVKVIPGKKDIAKNDYGVFVVKDTVKPKTVSDLPSINQLLEFLQSLLDASFLALIQHPPAHKVLQSLKAHIEPEISILSQTEQLRGLVEGFAKAHAKTVREAEAGKGKNAGPREESKKDWRQRRKEAHEQVGMAIGAYQLEELML